MRPAGLAACRRGSGRHCGADKSRPLQRNRQDRTLLALPASRKSSDFRHPSGVDSRHIRPVSHRRLRAHFRRSDKRLRFLEAAVPGQGVPGATHASGWVEAGDQQPVVILEPSIVETGILTSKADDLTIIPDGLLLVASGVADHAKAVVSVLLPTPLPSRGRRWHSLTVSEGEAP